MLAICFQYIGDEEDYIDNLEKLIVFAEEVQFTEKYIDRSNYKEKQSNSDLTNIIAEERKHDENQEEKDEVHEDCVQKAEEEHENVKLGFEDLNGAVSNHAGEIPDENTRSKEDEESLNDENIALKNNFDELKKNETFSDISGEIQFNVDLDGNGTFEKEAATLPTHYTKKCEQCDASFSNKASLGEHVRKVHLGIFVQCEQCGQKFIKQSDLKTHIKGVHEGAKIPCNICGKNFTQISSLNTHIRAVHKKIRYKCTECPRETTQLPVLNLHMKDAHNHNGYFCNLCDFKAKTTYELDRHQDNYHTFTCKQCNLKFKNKDQKYKHVSKHHKGVKKKKKLLKCSQCDFKDISVRQLKIHVKSEHEGLTVQKCNFCDYKTAGTTDRRSKDLMRAHVSGSHGGQQYLCSVCEYKTSRKSCLNIHMQSKHEEIYKIKKDLKIPKLKKGGPQIEFEFTRMKDYEFQKYLQKRFIPIEPKET